MNTVTATAFAELAKSAPEGTFPSFEDCATYDALPLNTKVRPATPLDGVTYGYTRTRPCFEGNELRVVVYWPQLKSSGNWPVSEIAY